jgi:hypothetical protein
MGAYARSFAQVLCYFSRSIAHFWTRSEGIPLAEGGVLVYAAYAVYVVKTMRTGYSLRISLPRDVQRHLGVRKGDVVALELRAGGEVVMARLPLEEMRSGSLSNTTLGPGGRSEG